MCTQHESKNKNNKYVGFICLLHELVKMEKKIIFTKLKFRLTLPSSLALKAHQIEFHSFAHCASVIVIRSKKKKMFAQYDPVSR